MKCNSSYTAYVIFVSKKCLIQNQEPARQAMRRKTEFSRLSRLLLTTESKPVSRVSFRISHPYRNIFAIKLQHFGINKTPNIDVCVL
jgi:hypothetical protein